MIEILIMILVETEENLHYNKVKAGMFYLCTVKQV